MVSIFGKYSQVTRTAPIVLFFLKVDAELLSCNLQQFEIQWFILYVFVGKVMRKNNQAGLPMDEIRLDCGW